MLCSARQFCCPATVLFFSLSLLVLWWAFHTAVDEEEGVKQLETKEG